MRRLSTIILAIILCGICAHARADSALERGFRTPPDSARPWVYWFWLNGNITREGITLDLEAMKRVGIGGVLIMEVDQGAPLGPVPFAGPKWRELFQFVVSEAHRLGLQVNMNDDAGWNGSGGPWITPDVAMQKVVWSETRVDGGKPFEGVLPQPPTVAGFFRDVTALAFPTPSEYRIPDIQGKSALVRRDVPSPASYPEAPSDAAIARDRIIDLTGRMEPGGRLTWTAPAGKWTVLRIGYTPTGAVNAPSPASGRGLECDKLSREGSEAAFTGLMGKLIADNGPPTGKALVRTHIDSWENGSQNWTPRFREEFRRLRGYDPTPYLPVFSGRVVDNLEVSERFLWDVRQTVGDLVLANYAGHMEELAKQHGIALSIEAYGDCVFDDLAYAGRADEPMTEFWSWPGNFTAGVVQEMASAAHVYGKRILGAEAFTATDGEKWLHHPATIKALGDWAFSLGVNRFVFHRYALQPWRNRPPGMSMGPWGLHYERGQTWWEQSKPWHTYLARCQYLLQQGDPVADVLYLSPEGSPRSFNPPPGADRAGYRSDACPVDALMRLARVRNGRIVLGGGTAYRALVLPAVETMTPALLARIKELADAGATVIAPPAPPRKSPSLAGYPACDAEVARLASTLWGRGGKLVADRAAENVLAAAGLPPDFKADRALNWNHRRIGDADVYFVANGGKHSVNALCQFRIGGRAPEIWDPETGRIERAAAFNSSRDRAQGTANGVRSGRSPVSNRSDAGVTRLMLSLQPSQSVFVVFRPDARRLDPVVRITRNGRDIWGPRSKSPQIQIIRAMWGPAGDAARTKDVTDQVRRMIQSGKDSFQVAELAAEGDPALNIVKTLSVEYRVGGKSLHAAATDPDLISFELPSDLAAPIHVVNAPDGKLVAEASLAGSYEAKTQSGKTARFTVPNLPASVQIKGPWGLGFPPGWGAPARLTLDKLISWSDHPDSGVKYFSGTAHYIGLLKVPAAFRAPGLRVILDLGDVQVMARVNVGGRDFGLLWKPPYRVDITDAPLDKPCFLQIAVTNLWPNRMIGDEQLPDDSARNPDGTLKAWPAWLSTNEPSPTGRFTFTSWRLWKKSSPLLPSGLLGPVTLSCGFRATAAAGGR